MTGAWLLAVRVARACDGPDYAERVVGWSEDGAQVLVRRELVGPVDPGATEQPQLELRLVDLATGSSHRSWQILDVSEAGDQALRGRRWAAAEAALRELHVTVDGAAKPLPTPWSLPGRAGPLAVAGGGCEDDRMRWRLTGPGVDRLLHEVGVCAAEASLGKLEAWAAPAGRGLLVVAATGCSGVAKYLWVPASVLPAAP